MKSFRFLSFNAIGILAMGSGLVQALPSEPSALMTQQRGCTETEASQAPWVHWAIHARKTCISESANNTELRECLRAAKTTLINLEREYAGIYRSEIRTLPIDHPVVQAIFINLKEKADAAAQVIEQDYAPTQMAVTTPPATCQNQN